MKLSLDGADDVYLTQVDKTPLFVVPWKPRDYAQGLHSIRVTAEVNSKNYLNILLQCFIFNNRLIECNTISYGKCDIMF